MTIRQSIAMIYALTALAVLGLQAVPVIGNAMTTLGAAVEMSAGAEWGLTGHAEIDDLPAYLTDENGRAEF